MEITTITECDLNGRPMTDDELSKLNEGIIQVYDIISADEHIEESFSLAKLAMFLPAISRLSFSIAMTLFGKHSQSEISSIAELLAKFVEALL